MLALKYNSSGEIVKVCEPCKKEICLGKKEKCLWNLKDHMTRKSHIMRAMHFRDKLVRKQMSTTQKLHLNLVAHKCDVYAGVNKQFPNMFRPSKTKDTIVCCICPKLEISVYAKGGSCVRNAEKHLKSKEHENNVEFRKRQKSIGFYFNSKP